MNNNDRTTMTHSVKHSNKRGRQIGGSQGTGDDATQYQCAALTSAHQQYYCIYYAHIAEAKISTVNSPDVYFERCSYTEHQKDRQEMEVSYHYLYYSSTSRLS